MPDQFEPITYPWTPDRGDTTYRNPILCADYSDPDAIRVGDTFWLTASSFTNTPGLPILRSKDLVNWSLVNHAIRHVPGNQYRMFLPGCGVWAPAIRHHAGLFWIFFPTPDEGIYVTTAKDPLGRWSEPYLMLPGKGLIDPCPLWDDDGQAYLVHAYANSRAGIKHKLRVRPMAPDASKVLGDGEIVFDDPINHPTCEGPKFYKRDGTYWIWAPAGGVSTGWQLAMRSKSPMGPYEHKIVLAQGNTPINGPHQGALVDAPDGSEWFLHFQETLPTGRIVHLQPVTWTDGWPVVGNAGLPVATHAKPVQSAKPEVPATSDDFSSPSLGLQWQWQASFEDDWYSLTARKSWLRLHAQPVPDNDLLKAPNILAQKFPAKRFSAETRVELSATTDSTRAGLVIVGLECAGLLLQRDGKDTALYQVINDKPTLLTHVTAPIHLKVSVSETGSCTFSHRAGGGDWQDAPTTFQAKEGRWIGAKVGLVCTTTSPETPSSHADFDYLRFS
jgi:beta-xylosidase